MQIEEIAVKDLKPYENNARKHQETDVAAIVASIKEFGFKDPIGVWSDDNIVVEGHGRLVAAKKLGMKSVPCIRLDDLTDEQRRAYALAHNKTAELSEWDIDLLDVELDNILDIDMADFGFDLSDAGGLSSYDSEEHGKLTDKFVVPPFSVLDARQGYWKERKRDWLEITGDLSETRDGEYGTISDGKDNMLATINGGTSNFDPVLAETMMKWFCPRGGI